MTSESKADAQLRGPNEGAVQLVTGVLGELEQEIVRNWPSDDEADEIVDEQGAYAFVLDEPVLGIDEVVFDVDEEGQVFARIELPLPKNWYGEVEGETWAALVGLRFYRTDDEER